MEVVATKQVTVSELASMIVDANKKSQIMTVVLTGHEDEKRNRSSRSVERKGEKRHALCIVSKSIALNPDNAAKFKTALEEYLDCCDNPLQYELVD